MVSDDYLLMDYWKTVGSGSHNSYKIIQPLGSGGNSDTYLSMCTTGKNKGVLFALKIFRKLSAKARREKFLEEIDFLKTCLHPSIMAIYDSGAYGVTRGARVLQFPFVVAEYLPNTLQDVIRANEINISEKLSYALQIISALIHISELPTPVIHRDIKPSNIFVKGQSCVLGDFGLMKIAAELKGDDGKIISDYVKSGMPKYFRTPDLVSYLKDNIELTPKSDTFQLGLVLANLFTGSNPLKENDDLLAPVELYNIKKIKGELGDSIIELLKIMLEIDPKKRTNIKELYKPWEDLFHKSVGMALKLEGKAF